MSSNWWISELPGNKALGPTISPKIHQADLKYTTIWDRGYLLWVLTDESLSYLATKPCDLAVLLKYIQLTWNITTVGDRGYLLWVLTDESLSCQATKPCDLVVLLKYSQLTWNTTTIGDFVIYSKTCVKQPLQNRQNKDLNGKFSLLKVESIAECSPWNAPLRKAIIICRI